MAAFFCLLQSSAFGVAGRCCLAAIQIKFISDGAACTREGALLPAIEEPPKERANTPHSGLDEIF